MSEPNQPDMSHALPTADDTSHAPAALFEPFKGLWAIYMVGVADLIYVWFTV